jgi:hypothetical protein
MLQTFSRIQLNILQILTHSVSDLLIANSLHNRAILALVQSIQLGHVVLVELKAVDICVADDSRRCVALGQRHVSLLQAPANKNLVGSNIVLLAYADEGLVVCLFVADERAVGFDDDVVLLAVLDAFALLAPGVELRIISTRCIVIRRVCDKPRSG